MKRLHQYSQHFIRNPRLVKELIGHTSIKRTDIVYDIGAGSGVISSVLSSRCKQVIAVEIEPRTAATLRRNMKRYPNVQVKQGDFLQLALPDAPYKVFSNIPFHLSSGIVRKLTQAPHPPQAAYLIVQKQFANKLLPEHSGFSSQLGMSIGPWFSVRIRKRLKRTDFWPFPNVDSVLIELKPRAEPLLETRLASSYRKYIAENFSSPLLFSKAPLAKISIPPETRPSQLTVHQWVALFQDRNSR
jgi:23S rRNA (adenine-N6)-dimethyltransferase